MSKWIRVVVCLFIALQFSMSVSHARQDKHHDSHNGNIARPPGWLVGHYTGSNKNSHKNDYTLVVHSDGTAYESDRDRPRYNTAGHYTLAGDFAWDNGSRETIKRTTKGVDLYQESRHNLAIFVKDSGGSYDDNDHHDAHGNGHHDDHDEHHDDHH